MFELFTDRARVAVVQSQEAARELRTNYIGTEHLLLGLLGAYGLANIALAQQGVAAESVERRLRLRLQDTPPSRGSRYIDDDEALAAVGIDLAAVRRQVEGTFGEGALRPSKPHIPFTPRAKHALELSWANSIALDMGYVGTEHILLGLLHEGDGWAVELLGELGVDVETMTHTVMRVMVVPQPETARLDRSAETRWAALALARPPGPDTDLYDSIAASATDQLLDILDRFLQRHPDTPATASVTDVFAQATPWIAPTTPDGPRAAPQSLAGLDSGSLRSRIELLRAHAQLLQSRVEEDTRLVYVDGAVPTLLLNRLGDVLDETATAEIDEAVDRTLQQLRQASLDPDARLHGLAGPLGRVRALLTETAMAEETVADLSRGRVGDSAVAAGVRAVERLRAGLDWDALEDPANVRAVASEIRRAAGTDQLAEEIRALVG